MLEELRNIFGGYVAAQLQFLRQQESHRERLGNQMEQYKMAKVTDETENLPAVAETHGDAGRRSRSADRQNL